MIKMLKDLIVDIWNRLPQIKNINQHIIIENYRNP